MRIMEAIVQYLLSRTADILCLNCSQRSLQLFSSPRLVAVSSPPIFSFLSRPPLPLIRVIPKEKS